jgi:hypothetical protein
MPVMSDIVAQPGERHLIYGTSRSGKSCHVDWEMREIQQTRPTCMQILIDSKPRFRAETERMPLNPVARRSAAWRYQHWAKGPVLPGSVLVNIWDDHPFRGLWRQPGEIAVMQSGDVEDWRRMLLLLSRFVKAHIGDRERHISVDEVLDFYGRTTFSISMKNDVFYLAARSGGERLIGETLGSQRVHGLPPLIRNMFSRVTLYQLSEQSDMKYLNANGIPDAKPPSERFAFKQWTKEAGGGVSEPFYGRLALPDSYLESLAGA